MSSRNSDRVIIKHIIKYDPVIVKEYFDALKLENLNVYFLSKSLEKDCTIKEKWFGTLYTKQPLLEVINENEIKILMAERGK